MSLSPRSSGPPCPGDRPRAPSAWWGGRRRSGLSLRSDLGGSLQPASACKEIARRGIRAGPVSSVGGPGRIFQMRLSLCAQTLCYNRGQKLGKITRYQAAICISERGVWSMQEAGNEPKCAFETSVYLMSHIIFSVGNLATHDKTTIQLGGRQSHQQAS